MSNSYFGRENDSIFVFQNNYFYTIGIITMVISLTNSVIIYLIGTNYLRLIKNQYIMCIYGFTLIYVSLLLGFLSLFILPTGSLMYFLMNIEQEKEKQKKIIIDTANIISENIVSEYLPTDEINDEANNDTSDEEIIKNTNPNDTSDEETSDEETSEEGKKVDLGETSDEEEEKTGQNCRGCGCYVLDGAECVLPESSKAYCSGCFENLEQPEEKNKSEIKPVEECNNIIEDCVNTNCKIDCIERCNKKRKIEMDFSNSCQEKI